MTSFKVGSAPWEKQATRTANSARPSDISTPVPVEAPAPPTTAEAPVLPSFPVGSAPWETESAPAEAAPPAADQFARDSSWSNPVDVVRDNITQLNPQNMIDRVTTGLAANDTEKMGYLEKKYGKGNVALKDDKIYFRRDPKDKLRPLDPATFELIADIIPDFMREIVTEGAMLPGELGGGAMFSPAGPGGMAAGATMGRIASVPMANAVADAAAEGVGIPRDPSRDGRTENMIGMAAETVLPVAGKYVAGKIAKRIPGTLAYKTAREAGEKETIALSKQSQEVVDAAAKLEKEGINVGMTLNQIQPDSPTVQRMAKNIEETPQFINKQREFAEGYGEALENNLKEIARRANPNGPVPKEKLATTITNAVEQLDRAEGQAIGQFRSKALTKMGNKKVPLPQEMSQEVLGIMKELGFVPKKKTLNSIVRPGTLEGAATRGLEERKVIERVDWVPPANLQPIIGRLGLDDTQARSVVNALNEYGQLMSRGDAARLTDVERLIKRMGPLNRKLQGSSISGTWGRLTGELRQHRRAMITNNLDEAEGKLFNGVMDDFSMIRSNTDQLSNVLRGDVTAKTLVNSYFKGKENLANVRALKSITGNDSAQWGALKEEFINQLLVKHAGDGTTGFNSGAFLRDLQQNYGDDFMKEVLNDGKVGPNYDTIKNLLTVGKRIEATQRGVKAETATEAVKSGIVDTAIGLAAGIKFKTINGLSAIFGARSGEEQALFEILNREGIEKHLSRYKGKDKGRIATQLEGLLTEYNAARAGSRKVKAATSIGKDLLKRGARADVREDLEQ